jgi:hypothetical protein
VIYEETTSLLKLIWSYMVFCQQSEDFKPADNHILWEKLIGLLNKKLSLYPTTPDKALRTFDVDMIYQLNCFLTL